MDCTKDTTESTLDVFSIKLLDLDHGGYGAVSGTFDHNYSSITSGIKEHRKEITAEKEALATAAK